MTLQIIQSDMFIDPAILDLVNSLKVQLDSTRKKLFAEINEAKAEVEFLSMQLQILIEKKDGIADFTPFPGG